jgi:hypothetical protein
MARKVLSILGIIVLLSVITNCGGHPEEGLLKRYFSALTLNDRTTLSTMALEPLSVDASQGWEIAAVTEERIEPFNLPEMDRTEKDLQKKLQDHVGPTMDAEDALWEAKEKLKNARTGGARRSAQNEVEAAQTKFDEEREVHRQLQQDFNEAEDTAQKEEDIATFSLGAGRLPNIRDLSGEVYFSEVDVQATGQEGTKNYRFYLRRYILTDETLNLTHRGRWVIVKIEPLG